MNEQQFAERIVLALDDSAEHLPYRVTHRLQMARQAALARVPERVAETRTVSAPSLGDGASALLGDGGRGVRWGRRLTVLAYTLLLVIGLVAISIWSELESAEETADVDMAVLTDDDVPISAYADRGFGVFLKNSRQ